MYFWKSRPKKFRISDIKFSLVSPTTSTGSKMHRCSEALTTLLRGNLHTFSTYCILVCTEGVTESVPPDSRHLDRPPCLTPSTRGPPTDPTHWIITRLYRKTQETQCGISFLFDLKLWLSLHVTAWSPSVSLNCLSCFLAAALLDHQQRAPQAHTACWSCGSCWALTFCDSSWCPQQSGSLRLLWKALGGAAQWSLQRTERSSNVCQLFFQPAPCAVMCFCKAGLTKGKRKMTYFRPLT